MHERMSMIYTSIPHVEVVLSFGCLQGGLVWNEFTLTPLDENLNPVLEPDDEERESLFQHKSLSVSSSS